MLLKNIVNRTKKVNELLLLDQEDEFISCTLTRRLLTSLVNLSNEKVILNDQEHFVVNDIHEVYNE